MLTVPKDVPLESGGFWSVSFLGGGGEKRERKKQQRKTLSHSSRLSPRAPLLSHKNQKQVTVYNSTAFLSPNEEHAYSFNSVTAKKEDNGETVIHFGGENKNASNYLPLPGKGWTYTVRLYRPKRELLEGKWKFPEAKEVVGM